MTLLLPQLTRWDRQTFSSERGVIRWHRIRERLADGAVYRTFWFQDRDDADAFLWAAITGSLRYERELWKLPIPFWEPPEPDVSYDFVTQVALTSTSGSNQTYTKPSDWGTASNFIGCIGSGGAGGAAAASQASAGGGAGGGWGRVSNVNITGSTAIFFLNVGGAGPFTSSSAAAGGNGSSTWMRIDGGSTAPANTTQGVLGSGGGGGNAGLGTIAGGTGLISNIGTQTFNGGDGTAGVCNLANERSAGGGGGAGGPNGAGLTAASVLNGGSGGGAGDNSTGGGGGALQTNGGNGSEIISGNGSGGGGGSWYNGGTAGSGGAAGGGGGASTYWAAGTGCRAGDGQRGGIMIQYTPGGGVSGFNMPMMGF